MRRAPKHAVSMRATAPLCSPGPCNMHAMQLQYGYGINGDRADLPSSPLATSMGHVIFSSVFVVVSPTLTGETWHGGISVNFFEVFSQLVAKVAAADPSCEIETRSSSSSSSCEFYIHRCSKLRRAVRIKLTAGTKKIHSSNWMENWVRHRFLRQGGHISSIDFFVISWLRQAIFCTENDYMY